MSGFFLSLIGFRRFEWMHSMKSGRPGDVFIMAMDGTLANFYFHAAFYIKMSILRACRII